MQVLGILAAHHPQAAPQRIQVEIQLAALLLNNDLKQHQQEIYRRTDHQGVEHRPLGFS